MTRAFRRAPAGVPTARTLRGGVVEWAGRGQDPPEHSRNDQNSPLVATFLPPRKDVTRDGTRGDRSPVDGEAAAGEYIDSDNHIDLNREQVSEVREVPHYNRHWGRL